jgi:phosphate starvation-inducible PhoH-like protein
MKDKVDPYMQPLYDALNDFLPGKQLAKLIEEKTIEIAPLAFMRGRTLSTPSWCSTRRRTPPRCR